MMLIGKGSTSWLLLAAFPLLASCAYLYPEKDPEEESPKNTKDEPQFEAEDYAINAKEYFHGGQYGRARDQWTTQLKKQPGNWLAQLGIVGCDYFLGSQALDRGDIRSAREFLTRAETDARQLAIGPLDADTQTSVGQPVQSWKAFLWLAKVQRGLADADHMQARIVTESLGTMKFSDPKRLTAEAEKNRLEKQRDANRRAALDVFENLVAMKNCSEDAIFNAAELHAQIGNTDAAERHFQNYLDIAERSRKDSAAQKSEIVNQTSGTAQSDELSAHILDEKIASNAAKQSAVLIRLGGINFDRGVASRARGVDPNASATSKLGAEAEAKRSYAKGLDYLYRARELTPDRHDVLVKMAQCQGELAHYEPAIDNLQKYITACGDRNDPFDDNLKVAFRMKKEFQSKLALRKN